MNYVYGNCKFILLGWRCRLSLKFFPIYKAPSSGLKIEVWSLRFCIGYSYLVFSFHYITQKNKSNRCKTSNFKLRSSAQMMKPFIFTVGISASKRCNHAKRKQTDFGRPGFDSRYLLHFFSICFLLSNLFWPNLTRLGGDQRHPNITNWKEQKIAKI